MLDIEVETEPYINLEILCLCLTDLPYLSLQRRCPFPHTSRPRVRHPLPGSGSETKSRDATHLSSSAVIGRKLSHYPPLLNSHLTSPRNFCCAQQTPFQQGQQCRDRWLILQLGRPMELYDKLIPALRERAVECGDEVCSGDCLLAEREDGCFQG